MKVKRLHPWDLSETDAVNVQMSLAGEVIAKDDFSSIGTVCGVDVSYRTIDTARTDELRTAAACVVLSYPGLKHRETVCKRSCVRFEYVPGLLAFREIPALIPALEGLESSPDLFICDGHGIAHQRGFGLACHLGLLLDRPVIGCAKTRLVGNFEEPEEQRGSFEYLYHKGEVIGAVLRTQEKKKPVFVSIGHRITLESAIEVVLQCTGGDRLTEPVRRAHRRAGKE
jgi:deoxyribonuclease V